MKCTNFKVLNDKEKNCFWNGKDMWCETVPCSVSFNQKRNISLKKIKFKTKRCSRQRGTKGRKEEDTNCNSHVISKYASMIVLVQPIQKPHSLSLMLKQSTVYRCRNLKQWKQLTTSSTKMVPTSITTTPFSTSTTFKPLFVLLHLLPLPWEKPFLF